MAGKITSIFFSSKFHYKISLHLARLPVAELAVIILLHLPFNVKYVVDTNGHWAHGAKEEDCSMCNLYTLCTHNNLQMISCFTHQICIEKLHNTCIRRRKTFLYKVYFATVASRHTNRRKGHNMENYKIKLHIIKCIVFCYSIIQQLISCVILTASA